MDELINKVEDYLGTQESLDKKVDEGIEALASAPPFVKFIFNDNDPMAKNVQDLMKSTYASGLANGYKDALIDERKANNAKETK